MGVPVGVGAVAAIAVWTRGKVVSDRRRAERLRALRLTLADLDAMSPTGFELAVRDLMIRDGLRAEHVGRRGDRAADVIGRDRLGNVVVVQCKHTTTGARVGPRVMYEVNGTAAPVHGADYAVVVTNGSFTPDARQMAEHFRLRLLGREELDRWAADGTPFQHFAGPANPLRRWWRPRLPSTRP
ncbi:restriction endonuclease [Streptosporangium longisporum]|uniref:Restriction endonuclease type IV Mrr domain-containing protein n=1 Tax=Streptosporangium longisporum TaxID=46187 RepID=A0ABP6KFU7_9ACTN